jgi:hypothetical protein
MEFEVNEMRRILWAIMIHTVAWVFLCNLRRKKFSIPKFIGWMTFNIFAVTFLFLNSYMLAANTIGDANSKMIYTSMVVSDAFFCFVYVLLNDYIHPSGYFGFSTFPKIFLLVCLYFYFDDRFNEILGFFALTTLQTGLLGLHSEEFLVDVNREEVGDDFNILDYYTLTYLDYLYISKMCYYAIVDILTDIKSKIIGAPKVKKE